MNPTVTHREKPVVNPSAGSRQKSPNILVVDDDHVILNLLGKVLRKLGFRVVLSNKGQEAVDLVRKTSPDVVLLDIKMPGIDGIKILKEIKADDPDVEVVMITGYASLDSAVEALKHGAFDYIQKPFDRLDRVVDAVSRAWQTKRPYVIRRNMKTSPERKIYELRHLYNISRLIASCTKAEDMIVQLLESLKKIVNYDLAIAMLTTGSGKKAMTLQMTNKCTSDFIEQAKSNLIDSFNSIVGSTISDDPAFLKILGEENITSTEAERTVDALPEKESSTHRIVEGFNSLINIPLINNGSVMGMINLSSRRDDLFTPDIISLVYAAASQVPSAIHRLERIKAIERERTQKLADIVSEGIIMINEDLEVVLVNRVAQNILDVKEPDLDTIQEMLGLDLHTQKKRSENGAVDLMIKEKRIRSDSYEVATSAIKRKDKTPFGFVISIRKSLETKQPDRRR